MNVIKSFVLELISSNYYTVGFYNIFFHKTMIGYIFVFSKCSYLSSLKH